MEIISRLIKTIKITKFVTLEHLALKMLGNFNRINRGYTRNVYNYIQYMFVTCKHAAPITPVGGNHLSTQETSTLGKNLGWNYHLPIQTAPSETFTSDLMASMMAPNFSLPSEWQPPATNLLVLGQQLRLTANIHSTHRVFFHYISLQDTRNQQGFETWNFHPKKRLKVQDLRSYIGLFT